MGSIKPKIALGGETAKKKKAPKQTQPPDPRGTPIMIMGPSGKTRMGWMKGGKYS